MRTWNREVVVLAPFRSSWSDRLQTLSVSVRLVRLVFIENLHADSPHTSHVSRVYDYVFSLFFPTGNPKY